MGGEKRGTLEGMCPQRPRGVFSQGGSESADVRGGWRTEIGHWDAVGGDHGGRGELEGEVLGGGGGFSLAWVDDFMEACGVKGAEK